MTSSTRRRLVAAAILVAVTAVGLLVHALPGSTATDIAGDALYTFAVYALVVVVAPRVTPLAVAGIAVAWCFAVEFLQLTGIPRAAAAVFPPARLVLGSGFDARDLVVYALAAIAAWAVDAVAHRIPSRNTDPDPAGSRSAERPSN